MAIKKLRTIIDEGNYNVTNIEELEVTPKIPARDLQQKFDANVNSLIEAIDASDGLIASIQANITAAGGGDMSEAEYATGEDPDESTHPVDRALFADNVKVSVSGGALYIGTAE